MKNVLVFPGQGSQAVGMMNGFNSPYVQDLFNVASDIVGENLFDLIIQDNEKINQTIYTQPLMLVAGFATYQILKSKKPEFNTDYLAGHSLGELTAALVGNVFSFQDAVKIVHKRAQLMQNAVPPGEGAMAAILGLEDDVVEEICLAHQDKGVIEPVNYNSPGQIVIAGEKKLLEDILPEFKEKGAKRVLMLPVSVPSHCSLMKEAEIQFADFLNNIVFNDSMVPIIQNVTAKPGTHREEIKFNLIAQLSSPVQWTASIRYLESCGIDSIIECGPGKVLTGLNKRIISSEGVKILSITSDESFNEL
jgi:[acyl-carrier-protein] S-malonyltransferase